VTNSPPRLFDRKLHRTRLSRAAANFTRADFLKQRAADDVVERLAAINREFPIAIELGARNGLLSRALMRNGRPGQVGQFVQTALSQAMLPRTGGARVMTDEENLPFAQGCADLIVSTLALHWVNDVVGALIQVRRTLKSDGLFVGSLLGGATLHELRQAFTEADLEHTGGAGPRVSPFIDASDAGDLMRRAGFALPVVDVDRVTVRYAHPLALLNDLRAMGETSVLCDRPRTPLSRSVLARMGQIYLDRFAGSDGRVPATFEIIGLTGWAPHPDQPKALKRGSATARLDDALAKVRRMTERER
jgi:SAM-dependent methyltransferase